MEGVREREGITTVQACACFKKTFNSFVLYLNFAQRAELYFCVRGSL